MSTMGTRAEELKKKLQTPRGRNTMIYLAFLALSAMLWVVQALNEETQRDLRCTIRITNVPDTLVRITPMPEAINLNVRAKGTQLIKFLGGREPRMTIDYRTYKSGNKIQFSEAAMKAFFRNIVGGGCQIQSVTPDSLSIVFTSHRGTQMPIKPDIKVEVAPQYVMIGKPKAMVDSVMLYSVNGLSPAMRWIETQPVVLTNVRKPQIVRVPLKVPRGMRAIPDTVNVSINVEPLISKTRKVPITPINVPEGMKLITMPSQIDVYYMLPMSVYKRIDINPKFKVTVDYNTIENPESEKVALHLAESPKEITNIFLSIDSIDFILEREQE